MKTNKEEKGYMRNIIHLLSEKMPDEAIQRTKQADTKKKYDTDGYAYQYCVDRFNDVCQDEWGYEWEVIYTQSGKYNSGAPYVEIAVKLGIWVENNENVRSNVGGHKSSIYADAIKGAITSAFKKAAAFWGVGRAAYAGTIDDDNKPFPDYDRNIVDGIPEPNSDNNTKDIKKEGLVDKIGQKNDILKKIDGLPSEVQDYFKALNFNNSEKYEFCKSNEWDLYKMKKALGFI